MKCCWNFSILMENSNVAQLEEYYVHIGRKCRKIKGRQINGYLKRHTSVDCNSELKKGKELEFYLFMKYIFLNWKIGTNIFKKQKC